MMVTFRPTITTTLLNRTPASTLHRVCRRSLTTIRMMTIVLNLPSSPQPPDVPMPDDPHTASHGYTPDDDDDDPFHTPFRSPPRPNDDSPDEEMHSPHDEPPDLPPHPSSPPDHQSLPKTVRDKPKLICLKV